MSGICMNSSVWSPLSRVVRGGKDCDCTDSYRTLTFTSEWRWAWSAQTLAELLGSWANLSSGFNPPLPRLPALSHCLLCLGRGNTFNCTCLVPPPECSICGMNQNHTNTNSIPNDPEYSSTSSRTIKPTFDRKEIYSGLLNKMYCASF